MREIVAALAVSGYVMTGVAVLSAWFKARKELPTLRADIAALNRHEARLSETGRAPFALLIDGNPDEHAEFEAINAADMQERTEARIERARILHRNGIAADDGPGLQLMSPRTALLMLRGAALAAVVDDFKTQGAVALIGGLLSLVSSVLSLYLPLNA